MKIAPLLLASATALESASTAHNLLAAVGHRNATKMEALVQGLVAESISEPGWKFDKDIQDGLETIRSIFVLNIQKSLQDAHKEDQEHMNCFTQDCFGGCVTKYTGTTKDCHDMDHKCQGLWHGHFECRKEVKKLYITMAQNCGALHSFVIGWDPEICPDEKCLCPDLLWCHRKQGYSDVCESSASDCPSTYGAWLKKMLLKYEEGYKQWKILWGNCKVSYHEFLKADMSCDATQKGFELCMCEKNRCEWTACNVEYEQCRASCWARYEELVFEKECLEKDRKIDWSATKKIECYVDILLHDYTKEELLSKCGSETCINDAREADYKHCHTICLEVDHDGVWPKVVSADLAVVIDGHKFRKEVSEFLLGDGTFKCDNNGAEVFTMHRGKVSREEEKRCTEHLDIDYQIPACVDCDPPPKPVCDAAFHYHWYLQFDQTDRIGGISDCCPLENGATCFTDIELDTSYDGKKITWIQVPEHSHAWAFNRCRCTGCAEGYPSYPPSSRQCKEGAHTLVRPDYAPKPVVQR